MSLCLSAQSTPSLSQPYPRLSTTTILVASRITKLTWKKQKLHVVDCGIWEIVWIHFELVRQMFYSRFYGSSYDESMLNILFVGFVSFVSQFSLYYFLSCNLHLSGLLLTV